MAECVWCSNGFPIWSANPYLHLLGGEDSSVCERGPIERELRAFDWRHPTRMVYLSREAFTLYAEAREQLRTRRGVRDLLDYLTTEEVDDCASEAIEAAAALGL